MNFSDFGLSILASWVANKLGRTTNTAKPLINYDEPKSRNKEELQSSLSPKDTEERIHGWEIDELAKRVLLIYKKHNIATTQISRFTPDKYELTLNVLRNEDEFLSKLTPEYLGWLSTTFGVCREWIEKGGTHRIYPRSNYYKNEYELLRWLFERRELSLLTRAFKDIKVLDKQMPEYSDGDATILLMFAEPISKINNEIIYRYHIDCSLWPWNYWRSRYQLKSIIKVCEKNNIYFSGYTLPKETIIALAHGRLFPSDITKNLTMMEWQIDDYVDTQEENSSAKDTDETNIIIEYMKEHKYLEFIERLEEDERDLTNASS